MAEFIMLAARLDAHTAHRIVGQAVRLARPTDRPLEADLLNQAATNVLGRPLELPPDQIRRATDPPAIVETRTGPGEAAPQAIQAMLSHYRDVAAKAEIWRAQTENRLTALRFEVDAVKIL